MKIKGILGKIGFSAAVLLLVLMALPAAILAAPIAPGNLTATLAGPTQVDLAWLDNSTDEKNFQIERATDAAFTAGFRNFKVNSVAGTGSTVRFSDNSVVTGQTFFYRIVAIDNAGAVSAPSNVAQVAVVLPAGPTNLIAIAVGPNRVELTWTDNAINETSYDVDRDTAVNFLTRVSFELQPPNSTSFIDTTVQPATTYFYRVQAVNLVGDSPLSNVVTVTTPAVPTAPPPAPTGLLATAVSTTQVNLTWTDASTTETGFRVERSADTTTFTTVGTTGVNVATFTDSTVVAGTTYTFRVFAFNSLGDSTAVVAAAVTTPAAAPAPVAPTAPTASFTASVTTGTTPLTVNFSDTSTGTPTSWTWDFGDGSAVVTVQNPGHTFATTGTFTVTLTATNAVGSSTAPQTITVSAQATPPVAGGGATGGDATGGGAAGGGGGGGGAAAPPTSQVTLNGITSDTPLALDSSGAVTAAAKLQDAAGESKIDIAAGTIMKAEDGSVLASLSVTTPAVIPAAPIARAVLVAREFGPTGATFSPAITITLKFDPAQLPQGVDEADLVIAFWDGTKWVNLDATVDAANNTVSAQVTHFTTFAVLAPVTASVPPATTAALVPPATTPSVTTPVTPVPSTPAVTTPPATTQPPAATTPAPTNTAPVTPAPAAGTNWGLIIGIVAAIVVVAVLLMVILRRKPAKP